MKDMTVTMHEPEGWMEKTGGYAKDMTLRDYFAANAMQGFAACDSQWPTAEDVAANAYEWADAMLEAGK